MSSNEPREKAVRKYFIETPEPLESSNHAVLLVMAVIVLGLAFLFSSELGDLSLRLGFDPGLIFLVAVIILGWMGLSGWAKYSSAKRKYDEAYAKAEPKPSDQQMDDWIEADTKRLAKEALHKLDLVADEIIYEKGEPIHVIGPSRGADLAVGKDGVIRFSKYDLVLVFLTEYHLAAYKGTLDMAKGTTTSESTQEYHYTDVVSVSTQTEASNIFEVIFNGEKKPVNSYQKFALSVASGERIEVVIGFPQLSDIVKEGKLLPTGADKAISVIRARLREKKGGVRA